MTNTAYLVLHGEIMVNFNSKVFYRRFGRNIYPRCFPNCNLPGWGEMKCLQPLPLFCQCSTCVHSCSFKIRRHQYMSECLSAQNKIYLVVRFVKAQYHRHTCESRNRERKLHPTESGSTTWTRQALERNPRAPHGQRGLEQTRCHQQ